MMSFISRITSVWNSCFFENSVILARTASDKPSPIFVVVHLRRLLVRGTELRELLHELDDLLISALVARELLRLLELLVQLSAGGVLEDQVHAVLLSS